MRAAPSQLTGLSAPAARIRGVFGRVGRVHLMTLAVCVAAVLATIGVAPLAGRGRPGTVPWYVLVAIFCAAEVCVVHLQFRREAHSFSLSEVPLVVGLFFARPIEVVLACLLGTAIALTIHRKQSPLKLAFNLANFTLGATVAVAIFWSLAPTSGSLGNLGFLAALAAVAATGVLQTLIIIVAISLSDGHMDRTGMFSTFGFAMLGTVINTCLALLGVSLLWLHPELVWLLVVPTVGIVLAYRSYVTEREKRSQVHFLYESSRQLEHNTEVDESLVRVLRGACDTFRAEMAEITLFPTGDGSAVARTGVGLNGRSDLMQPISPTEDELRLIAAIVRRAPAILTLSSADEDTVQFLRQHGLRDAMITVLRGKAPLFGVMIMGNRLGEVSSFDDQDLRLFEMLAAHTGTTLEKGRLEHSLAQLTELQNQLRHQAQHDPLTGMANRLLFRTRVSDALARHGQHVAVLFIDLDDFKTINDSLGHIVGDQLLCAVAGRLGECLRPGDIAARLGGDEFSVLLEGVSDGLPAISVAERIVNSLRKPFMILGEEILVHASIGIVTDVAGERTAEELLRNADEAMYTAKSLGKGRWEMFAPSMHAAVRSRHELKADLHRALERNELAVEYQPIVDVQTGEIVAAEALLRWWHPRRGLIPPTDFISMAEETGLIAPIGRWVLERACIEAMRWKAFAGGKEIAVSVNLSARQLQHGNFIGEVRSLLASTGLDPRRLILEVTESLAVDEMQAITAGLEELRRTGIRIALDDFGTGHSSLSRLREFPIDIIKIDKSFTNALGSPDEAMGLSRAIFRFCQGLGLTVIAEGVEDPDQLNQLRDFGCAWAQGFHLATPLTANAILALIVAGPLEVDSLATSDQVLHLPVRERAS